MNYQQIEMKVAATQITLELLHVILRNIKMKISANKLPFITGDSMVKDVDTFS